MNTSWITTIMNALKLFCLLALSPTVLLAQTNAEAPFESAREAVEHMRVGWNLGNTLDSNSGDTLNMWIEANKSRTVSSYETAWGQKTTKASLFKLFRQAGFNAIRVPVTWYPHMEATFASVRGYDNNGKWSYTPWLPSADGIGTQIQKAWMQRVKQIVDYVLAQGMYCIINVHHDTGAANTAWLLADEAAYAAQHERFEAIWTQIAEQFKDYDEHLLFEGYNEMLDPDHSWCFASFASEGGYNAAKAKSAYNAINSYAQSFVNAVRATGGNNAQRNLIVCTYGACDGNGNWSSHLQDPLKQMKLPDDNADGHLIFEVHCYPDITNLAAAKASLNTTISNLKRYLVAKGAPVIFGEWGISGGGDNHENHLAFVKYFAQRCKANGMGLFHWMGLSDGSHRTVPEFNEPDIVSAMMEGFYGEGGYVDGIRAVYESDDGRLQDSGHHTSLTTNNKPLENCWFDLAGRPINAPARGIYVKRGRKVARP